MLLWRTKTWNISLDVGGHLVFMGNKTTLAEPCLYPPGGL
jgi:hypothetical protein